MRKTYMRALALLLLLCTLLPFLFLPVLAAETGAAETVYSNAYDDLRRDPSFDASRYPYNSQDHSLEVIHLAEGNDGDVFVYVYQPAWTEHATCMNMSLGNLEFFFYNLDYINHEGVFYKYKIRDLDWRTLAEVRSYDVVSILRRFDADVDVGVAPETGNTIQETPFKVGRSWVYTNTDSGTPTLKVDDLDVIRVTDKYVGFERYATLTVFGVPVEHQDFHFVAFSTDKEMEDLLEIDISYKMQLMKQLAPGHVISSEAAYSQFVTMKKGQELSIGESDRFLGLWVRIGYDLPAIQTPSSFLSTTQGVMHQCIDTPDGVFLLNTIGEEGRKYIGEQEWVVRFATSEYKEVLDTVVPLPGGNVTELTSWSFTRVSEVSILRLAFETNDVYYNLGVVDNKQTGAEEPINEQYVVDLFGIAIGLILLALLLVVLMPFLAPLISAAFSLLWSGLMLLVKLALRFVLWILKLPGKLLGAIFRRR